MTDKQEKGAFISFEGGEGSGKSTQIKRLAAYLESRGKTVLLTREPGGTDAAEKIRALFIQGDPQEWLPLSEALLAYAARYDHVQKKIKPALKQGTWVLCDRFHDSTFAYQGLAGGVDKETLNRLHRLVLEGFQPDLTFMLDVDPSVGLERSQGHLKQEDRFEKKETHFHEKVRSYYHKLAEQDSKRCHLIDGAQEMDAVSKNISALLEKSFPDALGVSSAKPKPLGKILENGGAGDV